MFFWRVFWGLFIGLEWLHFHRNQHHMMNMLMN